MLNYELKKIERTSQKRKLEEDVFMNMTRLQTKEIHFQLSGYEDNGDVCARFERLANTVLNSNKDFKTLRFIMMSKADIIHLTASVINLLKKRENLTIFISFPSAEVCTAEFLLCKELLM